MDIGNRIKNLREKAGYSQNALAEKAGVSQTHLRHVERGEADITVGHLRIICDALGVSLKDFFNISEDIEELAVAISNLTPRQKNLLIDFLKSL